MKIASTRFLTVLAKISFGSIFSVRLFDFASVNIMNTRPVHEG